MQKFILFSLLVLASIMVNAQELLEQKIRQLEQQEVQAVLNRDLTSLAEVWSSDIMVNNPFNKIVLNREDIFARIQSGVINYTTFTREIEEIKIINDFVVTMGNETIVHELSNIQQTRRFTNIWRKFDGEWKISIRHANIICE